MKRNKKECEKCHSKISFSNYNKHIESCGKKKRNKNSEKWKLSNGKYKCPYCEKEYSKKGIGSHIWRKHTDGGKDFISNKTGTSWNKGLTKETDIRIKQLSEKVSAATKGRKGRKHTEDEKRLISEKLKIAHAEGRHTGWKHINEDVNRRSYPEEFFIRVCQNENLFGVYDIKEKFSFGKYFLDFAFVDFKIDVEIDGEQHYRNREAIEHDKKRDKFLINNGWKVYRINWKTFYNNTKEEIEKFLNFLEDHALVYPLATNELEG